MFAEPAVQQTVELGVGDVVVGQGAVLGPQLAVGGVGLLGMADDIQLLMVRRALEG